MIQRPGSNQCNTKRQIGNQCGHKIDRQDLTRRLIQLFLIAPNLGALSDRIRCNAQRCNQGKIADHGVGKVDFSNILCHQNSGNIGERNQRIHDSEQGFDGIVDCIGLKIRSVHFCPFIC